METYTLGNSQAQDRFPIAHDDMLGIMGTGTGANQWNVKNINDTLFPLGFLKDNSNDFVTVRIQSPHWRKSNVALDSIHIHYILDTAGTSGQTLLFTTYWTWISPESSIPALASWNSVPTTLTLATNTPTWHYNIVNVVTSPAAPTAEGYGLFLLVRIIRGDGTYTGEMGILDIDAHAQKDKYGSKNEYTD